MRSETEWLPHLRQKDTQQAHGQPSELILLDQLVQVEVEQLKDQAQVVFEDKKVVHPDNVVLILCISQPVQILQHPYFHPCLVIEGCLILDNFYCYHLSCLLAYAFRNLPKCSLTQHVTDNVPGDSGDIVADGLVLDMVIGEKC